MTYQSVDIVPSQLIPGVSFTIRRMSFGRRLDLMNRVREIAPRFEFFRAGQTEQDRIEAGVLSSEIDRLYLDWGLQEIAGLDIDGSPATPQSLLSAGPEDLCREAVHAVKAACGLSEPEIKN